jgi:recA bacterial DNA recombination protein
MVSHSVSTDVVFHAAVGQAKRTNALQNIALSEHLADICPASRLEVRSRPGMLLSGIAAIDGMAGGIPRGCITEICGSASSGKTSVLLAVLARTTRRDESCVLIDASDSFDPKSADLAGVNFTRLLWVRCGEGRSWRPIAYDRRRKVNTSELRLEQVLKAADLVLQSGGFGLVVLDLAGIPQKYVQRIPLASWFRFQRAVEHTKTALLIIGQFSCAQTCATLSLKLEKQLSTISPQRSGRPAHAELLREMYVATEIVRSRLERKPVQSGRAIFKTQAVHAG